MKVKMAAQALSSLTADAIQFLRTMKEPMFKNSEFLLYLIFQCSKILFYFAIGEATTIHKNN